MGSLDIHPKESQKSESKDVLTDKKMDEVLHYKKMNELLRKDGTLERLAMSEETADVWRDINRYVDDNLGEFKTDLERIMGEAKEDFLDQEESKLPKERMLASLKRTEQQVLKLAANFAKKYPELKERQKLQLQSHIEFSRAFRENYKEEDMAESLDSQKKRGVFDELRKQEDALPEENYVEGAAKQELLDEMYYFAEELLEKEYEIVNGKPKEPH